MDATLIQGDLKEEVLNLKEQPGSNILVLGSGELVRTLMKHDLVERVFRHDLSVYTGKWKAFVYR
ncbi:dihydrofolate reductase family protein [Paenibacillus sp. MZ03-122A]|uniref:dihydrofolate reductase family protein n=1 Tax=Paenibacillus sp. MZ03-122A TaxID=2962033 RepID=UPI0020B7818E|nr:dihydrofolate reductase family protein [Paenibacillus sp. MZ03-122A]